MEKEKKIFVMVSHQMIRTSFCCCYLYFSLLYWLLIVFLAYLSVISHLQHSNIEISIWYKWLSKKLCLFTCYEKWGQFLFIKSSKEWDSEILKTVSCINRFEYFYVNLIKKTTNSLQTKLTIESMQTINVKTIKTLSL